MKRSRIAAQTSRDENPRAPVPPIAADSELDLDALMARVRAAATASDAVAEVLAADAHGLAKEEPLDVMQVISAQIDWNNRTTKALAAVAECLRHMQNELVALQSQRPQPSEPESSARRRVVAKVSSGSRSTKVRSPRTARRSSGRGARRK